MWKVWLIGIALAVVLPVLPARATPYWTPEQMAAERASREHYPARELDSRSRGRVPLDEAAYFFHYRMLCDFLVSLQYTRPDENLGGMIEGESGSDRQIVQTDNTQEAIRVWSQYAIWTGDTARYARNIRLAQGYCEAFPAWREEGGGYYAAHNCGWGLEAVGKYRQAYGDTSWNWYADSCSQWLMENPLDFNPNGNDLDDVDPLAQGLGIGGMYPHSLYRQRNDWRDFTFAQARRLRQWFQTNPARFYQAETWALCGGTALWGLCASLFTAYPDSGAQWLRTHATQLAIWESSGTWNHSFNAWYCNAQHICFEITRDSTFWNNAVFITDSLIRLDTDEDGGIPPGRNYPVTNDHSWVSAYMGWMGMERIINGLPVQDVMVVGFRSPHPSLPHLAGDSLRVTSRVLNAGRTPISGWVRVVGTLFADSARFALAAGRDTSLTFSRRWVLPDDESLPANPQLQIRIIGGAGDGNPRNDTLTSRFDIRRGCNITGNIYGHDAPNRVRARVEFYHEAYPDSPWVVIEQTPGDAPYSNGTRKLMAGMNRVRAIPPFRYLTQQQTVQLSPGPPQTLDFYLAGTQIALIDDDVNETYEQYFTPSFDTLGWRYRRWNRATAGVPELTGIPMALWFTGNDDSTTLLPEDQTALVEYLVGGGHLLLTGQNISDDLGPESQFLRNVLQCSTRTNSTNLRRVSGIAGDSISDGVILVLQGGQGAGNQTSPSSVYALGNSRPILRFTSGDHETCGVAGTYESGKYVFLSVGLEAASGAGGTTSRTQFISRCAQWFNPNLEIFPSPAPMVWELSLEQNYPNPFNGSTAIPFTAPAGRIELDIFNLLGQRVCTLADRFSSGGPAVVHWNGTNDFGALVPSGIYFCRLRSSREVAIRPLTLLR